MVSISTNPIIKFLASFKLRFTVCVLKEQDCNSDEKDLQPSLIYSASCLHGSQKYPMSLTWTREKFLLNEISLRCLTATLICIKNMFQRDNVN